MLVISRKIGESLVIGDDVTITVVKVAGGGVRLGIDAPNGYTIIREELNQQFGSSADGKPAERESAK